MDIEKTMQFLLEQQARFDARQAKFEERFAEGMVQINDILIRVTSAQERTSEILATLTERHLELEENVNALVSAVDRHIASHK
jgi:hypothetical protein